MSAIDSERRRVGYGFFLSHFFVMFLGFFGIMQTDVGSAADIDLNVSLSEIYTSNLFLRPEELAESAFVTRISPALDFNHEGNQSEIYIDYAYEALLYANNSTFNEDYHQLDSKALVDLIGEELQLSGQAFYTQVNVDPRKVQSNTNISITRNRSNAFIWTVGPDWQRKLPFNSEINADYRYGRVVYDNPESQDVDSQRFGLQLASDRDAGASMTYSIDYEYWFLDYETFGDIRDQRLTFTLRQEINANFGLFGLLGSESHLSDRLDNSLSEPWWEVGSDYSDGDLNVRASVGERYFGKIFRLNASQQVSRWQFAASYSEGPGTTESVRLTELPKGIDEDPIPEAPSSGLDQPGAGTLFFRKRADGLIAWQGHKSVVSLRIWWEEREDLPGSVDSPDPSKKTDSVGTSMAYSWQAGSKTITGLSTSWLRREESTSAIEDTRWLITGSIDYQLGRKTMLGSYVVFTHSTGNDYEEFRASIGLTRSF
jgi:hypothetical protein